MSHDDINRQAFMEEAGDQVTRLGRTRVDNGNQFQVEITLHTRYYQRPS